MGAIAIIDPSVNLHTFERGFESYIVQLAWLCACGAIPSAFSNFFWRAFLL